SFISASAASHAPTTQVKRRPGTIASRYPISRAVPRSISGVLPRRTRLRRQGPMTRFGTAASSSTVWGASTNAMSAPADSAALARLIASSKPATAPAVGSRNDQEVRVTPRLYCCADLGQIGVERDYFFVIKVAATLGKALVFDVNTGDAHALVFAHRPYDVQFIAVACISISDHG